MIQSYHSIAVIPNRIKDPGGNCVQRILQALDGLPCTPRVTEELTEDLDLAIVPGGDGTILRAAALAAPLGLPLLGVNLGHIGYMAEVEMSELSLLRKIFEEPTRLENRMMLKIEILRNGTVAHSCHALNDAVLSNGAVSRMVQIELRCDGMRVGRYHADGLIIATPTGSTAYSLSAGGSVVDPTLDCFCVTPVSAHALGVRPMIFGPDVTLEVLDREQRRGSLYLTVDGNENICLAEGDTVRIVRSPLVTRLLMLKHKGFYRTLNEKMSEISPDEGEETISCI